MHVLDLGQFPITERNRRRGFRLFAIWSEAHDALADFGQCLGRIDGVGGARRKAEAQRETDCRRLKQDFHTHSLLSLMIVELVDCRP
jgi:hypothetical protein